MNKKILLILVWITASISKTSAQVPANDDCINATVINTVPFGAACSTSVSTSTLNATPSTPGTLCVAAPDDDVWFRFTATSSSIIFRYADATNISNSGQTSPSLALYEGSCPINTTTFFCQAAIVSGDGFRIINGLTPGTNYYLRLWSFSPGIAMSINFCIQDVPAPPANDDCAAATPITTLAPGSSCTSPVNATTVGATLSSPAPFCSSNSHNDDIWYSFVANTTAVNIQFSAARLATTNGNANLGYAVYLASCPGANAAIVCNGNLGGNSGSVTVSGLIAGQTYYVRFFSLLDNNYMTFNFCVVDVITAVNDECSSAVPFRTYDIGQVAPSIRVSTASATRSLNDPACSVGENNDDIWYRFTATTPSILMLLKNVVTNETGGGGTAGFALYEAACPTSAVTFACNNIASAGSGEQIINGLTPQTEYYVRLWGTLGGGNTVSFDLTILNVPGSANDNCEEAIPIGLQTGNSCTGTTHASTVGATKSSPDPSCANGYNDDDIWYSFVANSNAVRVTFNNATQNWGSGSATLGFAVHSGNCSTLPRTLACEIHVGTGEGTALVAGLTPGETYYLRFFSHDVNNYIEFDFCVLDAQLPENDKCANARSILAGASFCTSPVIGRFANATTSAGFGAPACAPSATTEDVWFRTSIPSTGNLVIQTSIVGNFATEDLVMEAYSGSCGALTLITCDDDGNPEDAPSDLHARISLSGRSPGEQIYIRVVKKYPITYNEFAICAWDPTALVPIAQGGNCTPGEAIVIDASLGNNFMWVPVMDASKHIIAEINARGNNLGTIDAGLFVNTSGTVRNLNGHFYLDRNVNVTPQTNAPALVRLYIKNNELQALRAADNSITGVQNLKVNKTNAACGPVFSGTGFTILQDSSGSYGTDHFIQFNVPSFSTFFIDGGEAALPLKFISFKVSKQNGHIELDWTVVQDNTIAHFEIQRSDNGTSFVRIGEIDKAAFLSGANNNWQYNFRDLSVITGTVFYRVKMSDENGKQVFSKVVALDAGNVNTGSIAIYPNPVTQFLVARMPMSVTPASFTLYNAAGILVKKWARQAVSNGVYTLDMQQMAPGIYFLQVNDGKNNSRFKVIKR